MADWGYEVVSDPKAHILLHWYPCPHADISHATQIRERYVRHCVWHEGVGEPSGVGGSAIKLG